MEGSGWMHLLDGGPVIMIYQRIAAVDKNGEDTYIHMYICTHRRIYTKRNVDLDLGTGY